MLFVAARAVLVFSCMMSVCVCDTVDVFRYVSDLLLSLSLSPSLSLLLTRSLSL